MNEQETQEPIPVDRQVGRDDEPEYWQPLIHKESAHYSLMRLANCESSMDALKAMFPDAKADEMNFVLFSTSGVHGTYQTIEEEEADPGVGVTFAIVHPRLVAMRFGNAYPKTPEDFDFLKALRQSSWDAMAAIGRPRA
jgi:hypothetical protein